MNRNTSYYLITGLVLLQMVWHYLIKPRLALSTDDINTIEGIFVLVLLIVVAYDGYLRWRGK